jgi:hypothetical protein
MMFVFICIYKRLVQSQLKLSLNFEMSEAHIKSGSQNLNNANWLEIVRQQVGSLRYGVVEIIVHDSRVTQIEKTERLRLDKPATETRPGREA